MSDATIVEDKVDIKCVCPILGYNSLPEYGRICDCVAHSIPCKHCCSASPLTNVLMMLYIL